MTAQELSFTPSKVTVNMDPVDLERSDFGPASGEREVVDEWMVRTEAGQVGPVASDLIIRGLNLGKVPQDAEIARPDSDTWYPVSHIVIDDEVDEDEEKTDEPVSMAKVLPIGQPEFEWPDAFAPTSEPVPSEPVATQPSAQPVSVPPVSVQPASVPPVSVQPIPQSAPPAMRLPQPSLPPVRSTPAPAMTTPVTTPSAALATPALSQPMASQPMASVPAALPSFAEEPIAIPTDQTSPGLIAFCATLGVAAFVGVGYAIIQLVL